MDWPSRQLASPPWGAAETLSNRLRYTNPLPNAADRSLLATTNFHVRERASFRSLPAPLLVLSQREEGERARYAIRTAEYALGFFDSEYLKERECTG